MSDKPANYFLDASDLLCPLPVLKARKKLATMASGSVLDMQATDPMSAIDMPHFCMEQGHELLSYTATPTHHLFRIKRK